MVYSFSVKIVLWLVKVFSEIAFLPVHIFRYFKKSKRCPPIKDNILFLSATDLARCIRKKEMSSTAIIKAYISRINEVNPIVNAVIQNRFQEAIEEAKRVDHFVHNTKLTEEQIERKYPLLGVPITIKGSIAITGMLHNSGSLNRVVKADTDATAVKYIKDAGAVPLLISNVPELCLSWETVNKIIGTTSNPYDNTRTSGGSSGGEASLIASGASVIGLGSDVAGSLRVPAHYCGIWGHKPSPRVVSYFGHYPESKNLEEWKQVFTMGPMTRYAGDLRLLLNIIVEPISRDMLKLSEKVDLKKIKFYYMKDIHSIVADRLNHNVIGAIDKVVNHFNTVCNSQCTEIRTPLMKYSAELSYLRITLMNMNIANFFDGTNAKVYSELLKFCGGKSRHVFSCLGYGFIKHSIQFLPKGTVTSMFAYFEELRETFLRILGEDGVLIIATSPSEAVYHNDVIRKTFDYGYCAVFNILGFPVTNCPIGFSAKGLPIGIQVVAAPNFDRLTLSVAEEIERAFGGWKFH